MNLSLVQLPNTQIITEYLSLKQLEQQDATQLFKLTDDNRNYLRQWLPWLDSCTQEIDSLNFITKSNRDIIDNKALIYGIFYNINIVGVISFHQIDWFDKSAKIGYWIGEDFQGQGLVTTACKELISIGFDKLKFRSLFLECNVDNIPSQSVAIRLGFQLDKTVSQAMNLYGRDVDHYLHVLRNSRHEEHA